jgi:RNA polymerase sigma-70 factor (ECF subfamily)
VAETEEAEAKLITRAKHDPEAFGALYERYVGKIYAYIYCRTGNVHEAEDLTARVFQRALMHVWHYADRGLPFSAWLYRIAHNLVANWHRDQKRRQMVTLEQTLPLQLQVEAPEAATLNREEHQQVLQAIRRLPGERQQLLALKFVEGLTNAEIGAIMRRSEGAIKSLYHRTLLELREELQSTHAPDDVAL